MRQEMQRWLEKPNSQTPWVLGFKHTFFRPNSTQWQGKPEFNPDIDFEDLLAS